jgi:hypothetical protein
VQVLVAPETVTFLSGGGSLILATVSATGAPHATRAWGVTFLTDDPPEIRLLLDANDATGLEHAATTAKIAVTSADVKTLQSVQFKGTVLEIEPATDDDRARAERFVDDFFGAVLEIDGTPRDLMEHLVPTDFVACRVRITELYDQTPGPAAGASLPASPQ